MNQLTKTKELSERFEVAFNQIDDKLKEIVNYYDRRFTVLVREGAKSHKLIERYKDDLEQYGKLRNAIVHDKTEIGYYIAEPHIEVVKHIEKLSKIFTSPNYALSIATRKVIFYDYEDRIVDVIEGIKQHKYSQYPIYKENQYVGLLTAGDVVKGLADHMVKSIVDLADIKVKDVMSKLSVYPLEFASKTINIFEVEDIYKNYHKKNQDLELVIITENGKSDETPLGLITSWDLIEIDYKEDKE